MSNCKNNLLEYSKLILERVSFSKRLFWKEYRKSIKVLPESDSHSLRHWMIKRFSFRGRTAVKLVKNEANRLTEGTSNERY
jgi:hypothetical protein